MLQSSAERAAQNDRVFKSAISSEVIFLSQLGKYFRSIDEYAEAVRLKGRGKVIVLSIATAAWLLLWLLMVFSGLGGAVIIIIVAHFFALIFMASITHGAAASNFERYRSFMHLRYTGYLLVGEITKFEQQYTRHYEMDGEVRQLEYELTCSFKLPNGESYETTQRLTEYDPNIKSLYCARGKVKDLCGKKVLMLWSPETQFVL